MTEQTTEQNTEQTDNVLTVNIKDVAKYNLREVDEIIVDIIKVLPLSGELETDFNGTTAGHAYGASRNLNIAKYRAIIDEAFDVDISDAVYEHIYNKAQTMLLNYATEEQLEDYAEYMKGEGAVSFQLVPDIVAVAVLVDSPGGSPAESHAIAEKLRRASRKSKIPFYTFTNGVAASGGYFVGCAGDEFYAALLSDVGSIGVVSEVQSLSFWGRLWNKVDFKFFTAGVKKRNTIHNPYIKNTKEDEVHFQEGLEECHGVFINYVKSCRGDRIKAPDDVAFSGECFSATKALKHGLIDGIGDYEDILEAKYGEAAMLLDVCVTDMALMPAVRAAAPVAAAAKPEDVEPLKPSVQPEKDGEDSAEKSASYKPRFQMRMPNKSKFLFR